MNWMLLLEQLAHLTAAFALAVPIGWERERSTRSAGIRTFPLVAAASCAYVLVGQSFQADTSPDASSRLVQGLMTGIGFIGGGAILKGQGHVSGTATAASIWMTGAIGAAAGMRRWELAIAMSILTFAALRWLKQVERRVGIGREHRVADRARRHHADSPSGEMRAVSNVREHDRRTPPRDATVVDDD